MGKSSRTKRRASVKAARKSRSNLGWWAVSGIIVIAAIALIAVSRSSPSAPLANQDHWHSAIGVNVCGEWLDNPPEFHFAADNQNQQAGLHSHGDGLIHTHPYVSAESGDNATVGTFFEYGGWSASADSFELWDNQVHTTSDMCGDEEATVRWEVNGEPQDGNISSHRPKDGDIIALALLPEGDEIGEPPSVASLAAPVDETGGATVPSASLPTDSTAPTVPGDTTATTVGETPTSAP